MDSFSRDKDKHKRNPSDFFELDDEDFERIFKEIRWIIERVYRCPFNRKESGKPFVHNIIIRIGPNGKPKIQELRNCPLKKQTGELTISEERESLTDVIEYDDEVAVTVEIPGVEKEDIDLNVTEDTTEITVCGSEREYHELIDLPCVIKPKTMKVTYKNGVLDVVVKRKEKKKTGRGYRAAID